MLALWDMSSDSECVLSPAFLEQVKTEGGHTENEIATAVSGLLQEHLLTRFGDQVRAEYEERQKRIQADRARAGRAGMTNRYFKTPTLIDSDSNTVTANAPHVVTNEQGDTTTENDTTDAANFAVTNPSVCCSTCSIIRDDSFVTSTGSAPATPDANTLRPDESELLGQFTVAWNEMATASGLPSILGIRGRRLVSFRQRIHDPAWLENWRKALALIPTSDFLCGGGSRKWKSDVDWFLRPDTVNGLLEGKWGVGADTASASPYANVRRMVWDNRTGTTTYEGGGK